MSRVRKSYPASGLYPHHEHRSKKGRSFRPEKQWSIEHKKKIEQLKINNHATDIGTE